MPASPPAFFDADWYLARNPDVARAGMDPARHFLRFGRAEGRLPCPLVSAAWARDMQQGLGGGPETFAPLFDAPRRAEQVWARVCAARAAADAQEWAQAADILAPLDVPRDLIAGFGTQDPVILCIEVALRSGDTRTAQSIWRSARSHFGHSPDLALAQANVVGAISGAASGTASGSVPGPAWARVLGRMYARHALVGVQRRGRAEETAAFDQLHARPLRKRQGPLVSVIVPVRNGAETLDTALRSLRGQSWRTLEILVIDNGSTDATPRIAAAHAERDPRVRVIHGAEDRGAYPARNLGMAAAQGTYITVLDADDWAHPARIALQVRALLRNPRAQASISHWVRATPDLIFTRWWGDRGLVHRNMSSLMIRADLRDTLGYWDRVRAGADTEYMARLEATFGTDAVIDVKPGLPLSFGRVQAGSLTQDHATAVTSLHHGARREYMTAAARWHRDMTAAAQGHRTPDLPLPQYPRSRPFAVPQALALPTDADANTHPSSTPLDIAAPAPAALHNSTWMHRTYPDLRASGMDPQTWFDAHSFAQGRDCGPSVSTSGVLRQNPQATAAEIWQAQAPCLPDITGDLPAPAPTTRHLLFVGHQAGPALFGAERSLLDMLDRAIACGVTPSVLLPHLRNDAYASALAARCHRIHVRPFGWRFGTVAPAAQTVDLIRALITAQGIDAVHVNTSVLDAPLIAARQARVPTWVHVRELGAQNEALCFDLGLTAPLLRATLIAQADHLVANSAAVADWLDHPGTLTRPNSVAPALFDLPFAPATPLRVGLVGSLTHDKGLHDVLALARAVPHLPVQFVLVGPDSPALQDAGPLPANVTHAGYAEGAEAAMAQVDVVLSLSKVAESYGRTVIEAMAAARAVIVYDRGTPPALVRDADGKVEPAGYVTPADDIGAIIPVLETLCHAPDTLHGMSQAARARAQMLAGAGHADTDRAIFAPQSAS